MKKIIVSFFVFILSLQIQAQNAATAYIDAFSNIAIIEMQRTGVPASIKLAQGLLESNYGRSELSTATNNHFGIKCGNNWNGKSYFKEDDDKDHRGKLIESCFRVYDSPEESFIAHSDFLLNGGKQSRYNFLFEYKTQDYKRWANGLQKAGYATDSQYPDKLINLIEKYELYRYDDMGNAHNDYLAVESADQKKPSKGGRILNDRYVKPASKTQKTPDFKSNNDVKMVLSEGSESLKDIADEYAIDVAALMKYNEDIKSPYEPLSPKSRIYLEKKKIAYGGKTKFHKVREGEKMANIAQHYAIDLEALYIRNRMPFGSQPVPGEKIQLKGVIRTSKRPELISKNNLSIVEKSKFVEETVEYLFTSKHGDKD